MIPPANAYLSSAFAPIGAGISAQGGGYLLVGNIVNGDGFIEVSSNLPPAARADALRRLAAELETVANKLKPALIRVGR